MVINLMEGCMLWVPNGYYPIITTLDSISIVLAWPHLNLTSHRSMGKETWTMVDENIKVRGR